MKKLLLAGFLTLISFGAAHANMTRAEHAQALARCQNAKPDDTNYANQKIMYDAWKKLGWSDVRIATGLADVQIEDCMMQAEIDHVHH